MYPPYSKKWIQEDCKVDCLIHEWGKGWFERTGSYVVDVRPVYSEGGVAGYLGKYLTKSFKNRGELESLGFKRRWSCSRNWPREVRSQLRGTVDGLWESIEIVPRYFRRKEMEERIKLNKGVDPLERVGTDLGEMLRSINRRKSGMRKIEGYLNEVFQAHADAEASSRGI